MIARAVALLALTATLTPSMPQHRQRGVELLQARRVAEAITEFEAALEQDPEDSAARFHLGRAFLASEQPDRAAEQLLLALSGSADPGAVQYQLGLAWLMSEQWLAAWEALTQAVALRPALRPASYALAEVCYQVGKVDAARSRLALLADRTPQWPDPEVRAAELAMEEGEPAIAAQWLARALEISPERPGLWMRLGDALAAAFDHDGAESAYRSAARLAPTAVTPRVALAYHLFNVQKLDLAGVELKGALELAPGDPSVLLPYAETLLYQGHAGAALAAAEEALEAFEAGATDAGRGGPDRLRSGALELQARILLKLARLGEAEAAARALLESDPRSVQGHFALGTVLQRRGDPAAADHLRAFKRLSDAREHRELGDEYLRLAGDAVAAGHEYRMALRTDPSDVGARIGLGRALLAAADATAAVATLEPLADQAAGNGQWLGAWILSLDGSGRRAEAVAAWDAAQSAGVDLGPEVWAAMRRTEGVCGANAPQ